MTKLGAIDFDDRIIDALRDNQLIIFAGAGVSMGPPSNLDSFWKLASNIARGTNQEPIEPFDRFLGQLHHNGVAVHERAAQFPSPEDSAPNALHYDLLRLFRSVDQIKLVTTNFDLHFETAASALFGALPDVYRAPALPLGHDFSGIVHVHGALPQNSNLILTDADFGRAYLTEGWARRFLVDVFRRFTVLFVGYSHDDVVMNYLARALPAENIGNRFALTDKEESWELLGITPINFVKGTGEEPYQELYDGLKRLAERTARGALDWQSRLAEIGNHAPPTDEEAISEIEQALRELHTTRFLLNVVRGPDWLHWLNARKHLNSLFDIADLDERENVISNWVTQHFAIEYANDIFEILAEHGLNLNPALWWSISRELRFTKNKQLNNSVLRKWITILLASAPSQADPHCFLWLAELCSEQGCIELTLKVFIAMSEHRLKISLGFAWSNEKSGEGRRLDASCPLRADHWTLSRVWSEHLKPHLGIVAQPLLINVSIELEKIHSDLMTWDRASRDWDPMSYRRSAIEPHDQDQHPEAIDCLIDAAREALEWQADNKPTLLDTWIEQFVISDVPLLRRLAIHAVTEHPEWSPEKRLEWVLKRVGLHGLSEHHEVHRAVALNYKSAVDQARQSIVESILSYTLPKSQNLSAEQRTDRAHFDWLTWLLQSRPDCALASLALAPISAKYPNWLPSDYPDLTHWVGPVEWRGAESPWSAEQLIAREPHEQVNDLLSFNGDHFDGPSREGLLISCRDACKQNRDWAFALGRALSEEALWSSDLWSALLRGLRESDLNSHEWRQLLSLVCNPELWSTHAHDIANLLYSLVKDGGKSCSADLLEQANTFALPLWCMLEINDEGVEDWVSKAINHPAGVIVEFWISGLSLTVSEKKGAERVMPDHYRQWFETVLQDETIKGGFGRSLIAMQTSFLFGLSEDWSHKNIIPLFSDESKQKFAQAWDGFLMSCRLYPSLVDALLPAFIDAMPRLDAEMNKRQEFIQLYAALTVFHVTNPTQQLLPTLFEHGSLDDRLTFASHIGNILRNMQQHAKMQLWNDWLKSYWQDRMQGIFAALEDREVQKMLDWLPHLGDAFPEAVVLATGCRLNRIEDGFVLYELGESDLITRFPDETAELLIYFAGVNLGYHRDDLAKIESRLPPIAEQARIRLDEAFAKAGVLKVQD